MNKITRAKDLMVPKVTTGPISASTKVYASPDGHADVRVPFREIALREGPASAVRVYDTTGPYTDASVTIDVRKGLARIRARLGARARRRRGIRRAATIKPIDNGNVTATALPPIPQHAAAAARPCRASRSPSSNSPAPASSPRR